jgi:glycosyltransferase involved in cell wall biosynthesis
MPDRLLFVHAYAPPYPGGTPIIVRRLLAGLPEVELETVTDLALLPLVRRGGTTLPGRYHYVPRVPQLVRPRALVAAANVVLGALAGVRAAVIARRTGARWILSVADEGFSPIAGDVAARLARLPHLIWVFDLWEENAYRHADRLVARALERGLWRRAAAILGHDQELADHYARKHGTPGRVLPTPIEIPETEPSRAPQGPTREVLFAGALYWAQEEALRRLARVCRAMPDVRLTVVGEAKGGIDADAFESRLSPEQFRARVEQADVAFVGLSFDSPHPEVIATASPARLPEYMASGTPILVHAPAGSHVAEYARRDDFAEVVDAPDDAALAAGLRRVLDDGAVSSMRARRARELALERHDVARVRERLRAILDDVGPP